MENTLVGIIRGNLCLQTLFEFSLIKQQGC